MSTLRCVPDSLSQQAGAALGAHAGGARRGEVGATPGLSPAAAPLRLVPSRLPGPALSSGVRSIVMERPNWTGPLGEALERAVSYLEGLPERPVPAAAGRTALTAALGGPLPERPTDPRAVIAALAAAAGPGVMASGS